VKNPKSGSMFKVEGASYGSDEWEQAISKSPLMGRGWVLQETTLAPRTLHFGRDRLYWQCPTQKASEEYPLDLHFNRMRYDRAIFPGAEDDDKSFFGPPGWASIVHKYSRCDLTFPAKDKLVAISAIAKKYGIEDDYLAGLWRQDLLLQLTWRAFTGIAFKDTERPWKYQAPSWSWASINKEIKYGWRDSTLTRIQKVAKIISTNVEPVSEDMFGQVSDGEIRIQGSLAKFQYNVQSVPREGNEWTVFFGGRTWPDLHSTSELNAIPEDRKVPCDMDFPEYLDDGDILYCMPIYYERDNSLGSQSTVHGCMQIPRAVYFPI